MTPCNAKRVLQVLAATLVVLSVTATASATCNPAKSAGTSNPATSQFSYWVQPPGYQTSLTVLKGRFWQQGNRDAANEGSCVAGNCGFGSGWLSFTPNGISMALNLGSQQVWGCPSGRSVTEIENVSSDGKNAAILVGTADEAPADALSWDYAAFGNRNLVPINAPQVTNLTWAGPTLTADITVDSAADAAFGPAGAGVINGYYVVSTTGAVDPGRNPLSYSFMAVIGGSAGGTLAGRTFDCTNPATVYFLAVQVLLDGGYGSKYVGAATPVRCNPACQDSDNDGDGYSVSPGCGTPVDCNDFDAGIHPGATELCNGIDDNCNGSVDDGLLRTLYRDGDGDGYGDPAVNQTTCSSPAGWILQSGDCNDANPLVHPGAAEVCNGIDDNCDAKVDEDGLGEDSDGDGLHNACDNCRLLANPTQTDSDGDHIGNACDNCINIFNLDQADTDGDGRGNVCDNCPTIPNGFQDDTDVDRVGDACDNCPLDYNATQSDVDHDGEGDACDLNDGVIYVLGTDDKNYVEWQQEAGPTAWNVYEGDLSVLRATGVYTQVPGSNPSAEKLCGSTDPFVPDFGVPLAGTVKFSLVTGVTGGVEGSLGKDSAGLTRPNANPCP